MTDEQEAVIRRIAGGRMSVQQIAALKPAVVRAVLGDLSTEDITALRAAAREIVAAMQKGIDEAPQRDADALDERRAVLASELADVDVRIAERGARPPKR